LFIDTPSAGGVNARGVENRRAKSGAKLRKE
jgi:hypothetical protein